MYIEDRLFSENTEEVLYSVLMNEDEYGLFSEFQRLYGKTGEIQDLGVKLWKKAKGSGNFRGVYKVPSNTPGLSRSVKYTSQLPKDIRMRMIKGNGHFGKGPDQIDVARKAYLG